MAEGKKYRNSAAKVDRNLGQQGPMGRTVEDLALLFDALTGENPADPASLPRTDDADRQDDE